VDGMCAGIEGGTTGSTIGVYMDSVGNGGGVVGFGCDERWDTDRRKRFISASSSSKRMVRLVNRQTSQMTNPDTKIKKKSPLNNARNNADHPKSTNRMTHTQKGRNCFIFLFLHFLAVLQRPACAQAGQRPGLKHKNGLKGTFYIHIVIG
ncbi:MAG: hypothetical protein V1753_07050, partial [Pseudomonadota bacterium]